MKGADFAAPFVFLLYCAIQRFYDPKRTVNSSFIISSEQMKCVVPRFNVKHKPIASARLSDAE